MAQTAGPTTSTIELGKGLSRVREGSEREGGGELKEGTQGRKLLEMRLVLHSVLLVQWCDARDITGGTGSCCSSFIVIVGYTFYSFKIMHELL